MRNILTIAAKELRSYFVSPIAYIILAVFALVFGIFFNVSVESFIRYVLAQGQMGGNVSLDLHETLIARLMGTINTIGLFLVPMITMRLFAEEKRTGTIELLLTSPVRDYEIVLGKWLAAVAFYAALLVVSSLNFAILLYFSNPEWKPILVAYLGLFLTGCATLALGTFVSTTTRNQIIAVAVTFFACLALWIADAVTVFGSGFWAEVIGYLSLISHFNDFSRGLLQAKDVVFFVTFTIFFLFLSVRSLESLRWRS
ncbi:MAG: ABC transporter permease subunit [Bryobacterales bacterium]|nr:ABC transporter permease subunit [Bryobacterales bacterium]